MLICRAGRWEPQHLKSSSCESQHSPALVPSISGSWGGRNRCCQQHRLLPRLLDAFRAPVASPMCRADPGTARQRCPLALSAAARSLPHQLIHLTSRTAFLKPSLANSMGMFVRVAVPFTSEPWLLTEHRSPFTQNEKAAL